MRPALLAGATLPDALTQHARNSPDAVAAFPSAGDSITARELDEAATRTARGLAARGVGPGEIVGLLLPTAACFLTALFGAMRAGAAVSVLPSPAGMGGGTAAAQRVARIAHAAGMRHVMLDPGLAEVAEAMRAENDGLEILDPEVPDAPGQALPEVGPDDLAIVQFTSGSTSTSKGVMLPHRAAVAGLRACVVTGHFSPDDVFVQWVPTFHDMGLIGLLSHWLNGADVHAFSPSTFLRRPRQVLEYFSSVGGTVMTGPNFAYDHILEGLGDGGVDDLDLSPWRLAFNGAEPVVAGTVTRFIERLGPAGFSPGAMYPAYGMAEATLAVALPVPGTPPRILPVHRDVLSTGRSVEVVDAEHPAAKLLVSCGQPVEGISLRIAGAAGEVCPPGVLGEIQISGPPVTSGYYRRPDLTAEAFDGEWFRTGDLGFEYEGEVYIGGRIKEMVIVRGQNFFPDDVEIVARDVPGVYRGRCVAFSDEDAELGEHVAVVVEADGRSAEPEWLRAEIARRVQRDLELSRIRVHLVKPRWLTRTTSGKWQRGMARARVAEQRATASAEHGGTR